LLIFGQSEASDASFFRLEARKTFTLRTGPASTEEAFESRIEVAQRLLWSAFRGLVHPRYTTTFDWELFEQVQLSV
jgi:hypothetical protein